MIRFNDYVHYFWIGNDKIPDEYIKNFEEAKSLNPTYNFIIWKEEDIKEHIPEYIERFEKGTLFQKLQLGSYGIANKFGGIVSHFDIKWKKDFDYVYDWFCYPVDMIFPYRESVYFYNRGLVTTLVDDFVFITRPNLTGEYINFCHSLPDDDPDVISTHNSHPYMVNYLTKWLMTRKNIKYFSHKQIDRSEDSIIAVHANHGTWRVA
jgi:hypothetical protein